MCENESLIARAYAAFNDRNVDEALALMSESVSWPKASEGGRADGKEEVRAYWKRQWKEFDPYVKPLEVLGGNEGRTHVRVDQLVKSLNGEVLFRGEVWHEFTIVNGLIERMDLAHSDPDLQQVPSTAFSKR